MRGWTVACLVLWCSGCTTDQASDASWWRGNLHTHSLWSDGDEFPEVLLSAYRDSGYHFVAVSDHNTIADEERWITVTPGSPREDVVTRYVDVFGPEWVERRNRDGQSEVRLKRYPEYASRLAVPNRFLVVKAEEITDRFADKPLHVNATNLEAFIAPRGGTSVRDVLQNNIDAVLAQRAETGRRMFPHVNHPNFGWAVTVEDLMDLDGEKFFEVYNGHPSVHNEGDDTRPGTERLWDIVLSHRLTTGQPVMYGIAVDDAHHYQSTGPDRVNPFRGWVMVQSRVLTIDSIVAAMERGAFYGSSGVRLESIRRTRTALEVEIVPEPGVRYTTTFIGTRRGFDSTSAPRPMAEGVTASRRYSESIGEVLGTVEGTRARYMFQGDELYVRARIRSSRTKRNPYRAGEVEQAWVQPVVIQGPSRQN